MTGKHYQWHKAWRREPSGHLLHDSGLRVLVTRGPDYTDLRASPDTLEAWQAFEAARGVPMHDMLARLKRLIKEAQEWHARNP
ncbi:MAG: hypothetical protein ACK4ZD_06230 [Caldimonas sp.]|uniref:hypothetical protein n=1 Tax=Caldimonas sp. TaxID=2838790 RepID=UPI003919E4B0